MSILFTEVWKKVLQNLSGKSLSKSYTEMAELLTDFNNLYSCAVTFATTPSTGVTIVVKQGTTIIEADEEGVYHLTEGSYTYDASADGYVTKTAQALTISNDDEATGTKEVAVELVKYCVVTFDATPEDTTIVVYSGETVVAPETDGTYKLIAGSYTYDATADGYVTQEDVALVISSGDATTGTKIETVTMVKYCVVTFAPKDSSTEEPVTGATIVVYLDAVEVDAETDGTYNLIADSYTYDISADGYTSQTGVELVISSEDATNGTKTIEPSLVLAG